MTVLVIADHDQRTVRAATLSTIAAALELGPEVHVLVAGHGADAVAVQLANIAGVAKVLQADDPVHAAALAERVAGQVLACLGASAGRYSHVLFPATANGKDAAPRLAAKLDVAPIGDVVKVIDADTFERPIYAGNALATVRSRDAVKVLTVRATAFAAAAAATGAAAAIEHIAAVADGGKARLVRSAVSASERPELASAAIVVAGGRALASAANFDAVIGPLADKLGAAIGASRAAVDAGYAPNDLQVGQTGKIVAPRLYLAVGISGAIQHIAGMKDADVIVAINQDPEAPIFGFADFGLEADLFTAVPQITAAL
ncbi:electron transfer flavoprotein alpha subunit apoprotein [Duganella sp. CF402]|uniref:electron transfer flavoprotein subunit alpha/FixB family protein n=1 Tax=unclassified Duganella TaxID=2636909 RepID=UPI0008B86582|nr:MULTISPECIES: FAD-binding protein [unclassified Duganella]RZT08229.1 electron transfer flavoprotein alpha subunit [Duganella sp. BK701]SEM01429.1 electron transfer flavoprotein alpha subunit apoprotein [Duganella sp. CF402]